MKILIMIWRDIKHPQAGGSELYFHELAREWIKKGHKVSWISGGWKGCKKIEVIDGIEIERIGGDMSSHLLAPIAYLRMKEKPDVIIDVENGIPFFTPLFSRKPRILHIHHVHKDVWARELSFPASKIGYFLEMYLMPLFYRRSKIITLSNSSANEIKKEFGLDIAGIVNPGIGFPKYKKFKKAKKPTLLFLNRIKKYKGVKYFLDALLILNKEIKGIEAFVAGSGDDLEDMKRYAKRIGLRNVSFLGKISEEKKHELMQKSWIFVNPSLKEGWGIVNIEANYFGTPVVGSNVSGIKDSVIDGKTGLLFKQGDSNDLANKIKKIIENKELREKMSVEARKHALKFSWSKKAEEYLKLINKLINNC
jgi:glycosyltransferase involved in cell wall biosynthesis